MRSTLDSLFTTHGLESLSIGCINGWKKFEPLWNFFTKTGQLNGMLPVLESILSKVKPINKKQPENSQPSASLIPQLFE
ncbi:MAG: hypothetical protein V4714_06265 [Bacteroidota bacterium]